MNTTKNEMRFLTKDEQKRMNSVMKFLQVEDKWRSYAMGDKLFCIPALAGTGHMGVSLDLFEEVIRQIRAEAAISDVSPCARLIVNLFSKLNLDSK